MRGRILLGTLTQPGAQRRKARCGAQQEAAAGRGRWQRAAAQSSLSLRRSQRRSQGDAPPEGSIPAGSDRLHDRDASRAL